MITNAILIAAALALLVFLFRTLRKRDSGRAGVPPEALPVDIEAFRNLVDPGEEEFLRSSLSPREFRTVQRERLKAAAEYVQAAWYNAGILLGQGEATRHHADPEIAVAGQQLVDSAIRLRLYCPLVVMKLRVATLLPGTSLSFGPLLERYDKLRGAASLVGRLKEPSRPASVSLI